MACIKLVACISDNKGVFLIVVLTFWLTFIVKRSPLLEIAAIVSPPEVMEDM